MDTNNINYENIPKNAIRDYLEKLSIKEIKYESEEYNNSIILYAPDIFYDLRKEWLKKSNKQYNDKEEYISYLNFDKEKAKKGDGKSGMLFIDSDPFIIKQLKDSEFKYFIKKLIISYYKYMKKNENSLLSKFYGIYNINGTKVVVMDKIDIACIEGTKINYDLKGSRLNKKSNSTSTTKIDGDFGKSQIMFCNIKKHGNFIKQVQSDSEFLADNKLMDYSLFVVICPTTNNTNKINNTNDKDISKFKAVLKNNNQYESNQYKSNKDVEVKCGIIDFLQNYNLKKNIQSKARTSRKRATTRIFSGFTEYAELQKTDVSSIPPEKYKIRFDKYIANRFRNNRDGNPGISRPRPPLISSATPLVKPKK